MKNRVFLTTLLAAVFAVVLLIVPQANADVHTLNFTGSIIDVDLTNPWGLDGSSLVSGSATYDTADIDPGTGEYAPNLNGGLLSISVGSLVFNESDDFLFPDFPVLTFETPLGNPEALSSFDFYVEFGDSLQYVFWAYPSGSVDSPVYFDIFEYDGPNYVHGSFDLPVSWQDPGTIGSNVPVPAAVWLLGSGLAGLAGLRRKFMS